MVETMNQDMTIFAIVFAVLFILATIFSVAVAKKAERMGRSFSTYLALCFFLSPIIALIILQSQGRATKEEVLNSTPHIFYCPSCKSTYSGESNVNAKCPDCKILTEETIILRDDWRKFSEEKKTQMREAFSKGQYLRNRAHTPITISAPSGADEIKKYKELLDAGAISQEEYEAKKKQILNL